VFKSSTIDYLSSFNNFKHPLIAWMSPRFFELASPNNELTIGAYFSFELREASIFLNKIWIYET